MPFNKSQNLTLPYLVIALLAASCFSVFLSLSLYVVSVILAALVVLAAEMYESRGKIVFRSYDLAVVFLFAMPTFSYFWSIDRIGTMQRAPILLINILIYYIASRQRIGDAVALMLRLPLILPVLIGISFLMLAITFGTVRQSDPEVVRYVGSYSNIAAAFAVLCVPFAVLGAQRATQKLPFYIALAVIGLIVILAESRASIVLYFGGLLLTVMMMPGRAEVKTARLLVLLAALFLTVVALAPLLANLQAVSSVIQRFAESQLFELGGAGMPLRDEGDFGRAVMYFEGFKIVRENWLMGIGYGALYARMEALYDFGLASHNLIITAVGEMGMLGLFSVVWALGAGVARLWRVRRDEAEDFDLRCAATVTIAAIAMAVVQAQFRPFHSHEMIPLLLAMAALLGRSRRTEAAIVPAQ